MTHTNSDPEAVIMDQKQSPVGMDPHLSHDEGETCAAINNDETAHVTDHDAERKLCFKFDVRLLPVLAVMCAYTKPPSTFHYHPILTIVFLQTSSMPSTKATLVTLKPRA